MFICLPVVFPQFYFLSLQLDDCLAMLEKVLMSILRSLMVESENGNDSKNLTNFFRCRYYHRVRYLYQNIQCLLFIAKKFIMHAWMTKTSICNYFIARSSNNWTEIAWFPRSIIFFVMLIIGRLFAAPIGKRSLHCFLPNF